VKNMDDIINNDLLSHLKFYFDRIYEKKLDLEIEGVNGFNPKSQFVEGKVVNACSLVYELMSDDSQQRVQVGRKLTEIIDLMAQREYETWGILNCIIALHRLNSKKLLNEVVSESSLALFKRKLDWRTFVNTDDLGLINKPTNYYGVAFGIAKYRELLGFETENWSDRLLEKLLHHVDLYSGEFSFMDETEGHGRFDRYSILIPGEICSMLYDTGCNIPQKLITMLKKSCSIFLQLSNIEGKGFSYGRSIGAYGDSATMEVLSIGALLGILTKNEMELAYNFCYRSMERFCSFWINKKISSLNMWNDGRKTDDYRNKNRILGENLSLPLQYIHSYEYWKSIGFSKTEPLKKLDKFKNLLPIYSKFEFSSNIYSRNLYIIRDRDHVITIPFINGSEKYYRETPYLPIPNEFDVFTTSANSVHPNLIPKLILNNGIEAMPIVYYENIKDNINYENNRELIIECNLSKLAQLGENSPREFDGIKATIIYEVKPNTLKCRIILDFDYVEICNLKKIEMEFATFSNNIELENEKTLFKSGSVKSLIVLGLDRVFIDQNLKNGEYSTPVGQLNTLLKFEKETFNLENKSMEIEWIINYQ